MSVNNWKGFSWDNANRVLDISNGNIGVDSRVYFRNTSKFFTGTYNSLDSKPELGQQYKFSDSLISKLLF